MKILPPFKPNEYLFENHKDKGTANWEIFAWAVRDIMSIAGPIEKSDQTYREKLEYEQVLGYKQKKEKNGEEEHLITGSE